MEKKLGRYAKCNFEAILQLSVIKLIKITPKPPNKQTNNRTNLDKKLNKQQQYI